MPRKGKGPEASPTVFLLRNGDLAWAKHPGMGAVWPCEILERSDLKQAAGGECQYRVQFIGFKVP